MALKDDDVSCVVVYRETPSRDWELCTRTLRKSVAFRSAYLMQDQERLMGHKRFQAGVMLAEVWDTGRRQLLKPPAGFEALMDTESKEVEAKHTANMERLAAAQLEQQRALPPPPKPEPEYTRPEPQPEPEPAPEPEEEQQPYYGEPEL